jgi:hypothetical protein
LFSPFPQDVVVGESTFSSYVVSQYALEILAFFHRTGVTTQVMQFLYATVTTSYEYFACMFAGTVLKPGFMSIVIVSNYCMSDICLTVHH